METKRIVLVLLIAMSCVIVIIGYENSSQPKPITNQFNHLTEEQIFEMQLNETVPADRFDQIIIVSIRNQEINTQNDYQVFYVNESTFLNQIRESFINTNPDAATTIYKFQWDNSNYVTYVYNYIPIEHSTEVISYLFTLGE